MGVQPIPSVKRNDEAIGLAVAILRQRFGERCQTGLAVREQHGHTTTWIRNQPPDAVVFAHSTDDVVDVVKVCAERGVPIIPFGTGTSLEGHVNAPAGGISIDLRSMDRVIAVHDADLDCVVEPGITRKELNENLRDRGLFFPIDPGADASLGGMAATRASGTNAVRYGTMRDNVISLKAVTATGEVISTGSRAKKSAAGFDLTRLFIGSEGMLGVITELTLRLQGIPEATSAAVCAFPDVESACQTVILTIQSGIPVARIELLDELQMKATNIYADLGLAETPTLFIEFHGSSASVEEQARAVGEIASDYGGSDFTWSTRPEERSRLWQARHDAYWAVQTLRPGVRVFATDVCVPISRLADCVMETRRDLEENGLLAPITGHVGDGNFHCSVLVDDTDPAEVAAAETFSERLAVRAIAMEGTCTGEHGIGQGKMGYLGRELGGSVDLMRAIKHALDPEDIFNPGKVFA